MRQKIVFIVVRGLLIGYFQIQQIFMKMKIVAVNILLIRRIANKITSFLGWTVAVDCLVFFLQFVFLFRCNWGKERERERERERGALKSFLRYFFFGLCPKCWSFSLCLYRNGNSLRRSLLLRAQKTSETPILSLLFRSLFPKHLKILSVAWAGQDWVWSQSYKRNLVLVII